MELLSDGPVFNPWCFISQILLLEPRTGAPLANRIIKFLICGMKSNIPTKLDSQINMTKHHENQHKGKTCQRKSDGSGPETSHHHHVWEFWTHLRACEKQWSFLKQQMHRSTKFEVETVFADQRPSGCLRRRDPGLKGDRCGLQEDLACLFICSQSGASSCCWGKWACGFKEEL